MAENNLTSSYDGRGNVTLYGASATSSEDGVVTMSLDTGDRPEAKAVAHVNLSFVSEVESTCRYYILQPSIPDKPTTNPPVSPWSDTEPTYTAGSTDCLYFVDLIEFTDGSWSYSEVNLSSSYEASKEAINRNEATRAELHENIVALQLNADSIRASVESLTTTTSQTAESIEGEIATLKNRVDAVITSDQVQLQIQNELSNGVNKVTTETGFTFDSDGLKVTKSDSEMETSITEDGMTVSRSGEEVLRADNEGVKAEDLHATTYLIIGENSRFEDYTFDGEARTGCFWIGPTNA